MFSDPDRRIVKLSTTPWRQEKFNATRTISDVKEVVDDRVSVVRDLKTDSVITTWLLQRYDQRIQVLATAEETSKLNDLYSLIRNLHPKISRFVSPQSCTKGQPCFSDRWYKRNVFFIVPSIPCQPPKAGLTISKPVSFCNHAWIK